MNWKLRWTRSAIEDFLTRILNGKHLRRMRKLLPLSSALCCAPQEIKEDIHMYFINEKAMAMSRDGKSVSFENGLPTLYQVQKTNPNRKIVIWNDEHKNIHVETLFSNADDIIIAIKRFEKGQKYY
nr:MAG TPA: hypothetical protein [Caudoviricetes sp.]